MSDTRQGPDWWQASDDKWYPPPRPEMPGDAVQTAVASQGMAPSSGVRSGPPFGPPAGPPSGGFPPGAPTSPSGGVPSDAPGAATRTRTPLYIAIGVVVMAAIIGLIVVLSGDDGDPKPAASPVSTELVPTTEVTPTSDGTPDATDAERSGDAKVELVDKGFSNFIGSGFDQGERSVAYGFIVQNTGDDTAVDVQVSVTAYDASGAALASDSHIIYVLRAGEKFGIGDEFFGTTFATDVAELDVQVDGPIGDVLGVVPDEGTLTADDITTTADDFNINTTFTATSTYGQQIQHVGAYAIYRDPDGNIIGGSTGGIDTIAADGSIAGEVLSWALIPNVASTEVYLDPGTFD